MVPLQMKKFLLEAAQFTWQLYNQIIFILICVYYHILSLLEQSTNTCDYIIAHSSNSLVGGDDRSSLSSSSSHSITTDLRIPKHIALCFTNELNYLDIDSISRILCWCRQLNISYITLYDELGKLKCKRKELVKCFEKRMRLLGCEKPIDHIEGMNIISRSDGRPEFIEHIKKLLNRAENPDDINLEDVNKQVGWTSDPEMLINFGLPLCLYGFPPWPLRLTEIFSIPTHRRVPQRIFVDCLRRYSRTSQRIGA